MYSQYEEAIAKLSEAMAKVEDKARKEGRALTAEEAGWMAECKAEINEQRKHLPANSPLTLERNHQFGYNQDGTLASVAPIAAPMGRDYRSFFGLSRGERLDTGGFGSCAEFLRVMDSGRYDPRLQVRASMGEGVPSSGGFSVPTQFASEWLDASLPNEIVRNLCRLYPMESETKEIPGWDGANMSSGATHGGLTMEFMAEGSTKTPQTAKMRMIKLTARMAGIYVDASIELVQDGKDFATNLETALKQSVGYGIDRYCIAGSGAGCPQGILSAPCKIQIAAESGQKADTMVYQNIKKMFARQLNPERAVWLFNPSVIPDLLEMSVAVGTGGSFIPLLNESNGKFTIFGRPVYFHPVMPAIGDADDCAFVDFNFYGLGLRKEVWIDMTDAVRWAQRERSFRILMRFDGMCTLNAAVTPENGVSLSPVVTMAAR
jgi:HK97 family phage major capsid protein